MKCDNGRQLVRSRGQGLHQSGIGGRFNVKWLRKLLEALRQLLLLHYFLKPLNHQKLDLAKRNLMKVPPVMD